MAESDAPGFGRGARPGCDVDMEADAPDWLCQACAEVSAEVRRLRGYGTTPVVVALDGGSGAGKSTLAVCVAADLNAVVVPLDDFFSAQVPEGLWETLEVAERLQRAFDWHRVREHALKPLRAGRRGSWYPFDFVGGLRPDGTYGMQRDPVEVGPADVIILEGALSGHPELRDLVDLAVLVDVPVAVRHARTAARDEPAFLSRWHPIWDPVEAYYRACVRPRESFDLVVNGGEADADE